MNDFQNDSTLENLGKKITSIEVPLPNSLSSEQLFDRIDEIASKQRRTKKLRNIKLYRRISLLAGAVAVCAFVIIVPQIIAGKSANITAPQSTSNRMVMGATSSSIATGSSSSMAEATPKSASSPSMHSAAPSSPQQNSAPSTGDGELQALSPRGMDNFNVDISNQIIPENGSVIEIEPDQSIETAFFKSKVGSSESKEYLSKNFKHITDYTHFEQLVTTMPTYDNSKGVMPFHDYSMKLNTEFIIEPSDLAVKIIPSSNLDPNVGFIDNSTQLLTISDGSTDEALFSLRMNDVFATLLLGTKLAFATTSAQHSSGNYYTDLIVIDIIDKSNISQIFTFTQSGEFKSVNADDSGINLITLQDTNYMSSKSFYVHLPTLNYIDYTGTGVKENLSYPNQVIDGKGSLPKISPKDMYYNKNSTKTHYSMITSIPFDKSEISTCVILG